MKKKLALKNRLLLVVILILSFTVFFSCQLISGKSSVYYVSKEGNDNWSGRLKDPNKDKTDGPFLTITKASQHLNAGETCMIHEGIYREIIVPQTSGEAKSKIVYKAFNNEKVIISGCNLMEANWQKDTENIYKTSLAKSAFQKDMFIDGQKAIEARWPNFSGDFLKPTYSKVDKGTFNTMTDEALPEKALDGCTMHAFFGKEWALQTMTVSSYDPNTKTISFPIPERRFNYYGGEAGFDRNYGPREGNRFYLFGHYNLLDIEGEWFYNDESSELFIYTEHKHPNQKSIEVKARDYAIDLSGKSYIEVVGLELRSAGIKMDSNTANCTIERVKGLYVDPGIQVNGRKNELKSCEFSYAAKAIVTVNGQDNRIVNNYIHDGNFSGSWSQILEVKGLRQLVSHNTVERAGGGCISPGAKQSVYQYNEIGNAGLIRHDVGGFYMANYSGDNSVIAYNRVHDVYGIGIYLDNSTSNYILHHNIIWNCGWEYVLSEPPMSFLSISAYDAIRFNTPGNYNLIYNNTCYNRWSFGYWGRNFKKDMYGDFIMNNIFTGRYNVGDGVVSSHNIYKDIDPLLVDPENENFQLAANSPSIDQAILLKSINDDFVGNAPDCGALEYGKKPWKAGHDFDNPPNPKFVAVQTDFMNRVKNGGFESQLDQWKISGESEVSLAKEDSWGIETANTRMQLYSAKLERSGSAIEQKVTGLKPDSKYTFSVWFKVEGAKGKGEMSVKGEGIAVSATTNIVDKWEFIKVDFNTTKQTEVVVLLKNISENSSAVYCDDSGLIRKFEK